MNVSDKMHLISFISPTGINISGDFSLQVTHTLSKILLFKKYHFKSIRSFQLIENHLFTPIQQVQDRNVSITKAVRILTQNNIIVDESDASIILDFLYLIAKFSKERKDKITLNTLSENRTAKIGLKHLNTNENRPNLKTV